MIDQTTPPSDITPGMVSFLENMWSISDGIFEKVFKELVRIEDIDGLKVCLANETVKNEYAVRFSYHLLPLKNSSDPEAQALYQSSVARITATGVTEMTERMKRLSQLNLMHTTSRPTLDEIRSLIRLGADIEAPICPAKRTPLGDAVLNFRTITAIEMMSEFAVLHPGRLPLAAKGVDVCTFILKHCMDHHDIGKVLNWIGQNIKASEESKLGPSKYLKKVLEGNKELGKEFRSCYPLSTFIYNDLLNSEVLRLLCSKGSSFPDIAQPFLIILSHMAGKTEETIPALHKLIAAGVDIKAPLDNGAIPLSYIVQGKPSEYVKEFLELTDHSADLERIMKDDTLMKKVNKETLNMALAITAKNKMMQVIKKNTPAPNP